jgi:hypothetical protein
MTTSLIPPRASRRQTAPVLGQPRHPAPATPGATGRAAASWPHRITYLRHWTGWLLCGMLLALLWLCWLGPALRSWLSTQVAQYQYGPARIATLDADVGQGGLSHLLAEDLHGTILVLDVLPVPTGASPTVSVCAFPHLVGEAPGDRPHVITLQVGHLQRDPRAAVLVQVEGVPFTLVCRCHPRGIEADPSALADVPAALHAGVRRFR